jgi:phosphomevalonate kinase
MPGSAERVLAPGKLVIAGEYAVVDGAPALVLAIDRGVLCDVLARSGPLDIETPDGDDRFVRPALEAQRGRFRFGAWNPVDLPGKPGFGGSAAACVAACVAAGRPAADAFGIHRSVQGSGSGVDVAAAVHGGMIRFQAGAVRPVPAVHPVVVYSGRSAKTGPRVQRYRAWADRAAFQRESAALVDAFHTDPVRMLAEAGTLLNKMAAAAGLAYRTPGLDRIAALARAHGGAAKPSGAGGGDCAVALFDEPDAGAAFAQACAAAGLPPIPVSPAPGAHRVAAGPGSTAH